MTRALDRRKQKHRKILKPKVIAWKGSFGYVVAKGAKIVDWGKVPK